MSAARPPRPPLSTKPPDHEALAWQVYAVREFFPELEPLADHAASDPEVAGWLRRFEATRHYLMLRASGLGSVEARHRAARHVGVHERSLRRWGVGDD